MTTNSTGRWIALPNDLLQRGILGLNNRNMRYILESNPRELYPRVDNKLNTKEICHRHNIPVPQTFAVIKRYGDVYPFLEEVGKYEQFVVKPASGAGGRGIMVVAGRRGRDFLTGSGRIVQFGELRYHLSTILSGLFSLGGQMDAAIIEERIIIHPVMEGVAVGGTPDIRVILYRQVPVMAMVRLPTSLSDGRANLHQGAAATAVNLSTGKTFGGVCLNRTLSHHPDTGAPIAGWEIPEWKKVLEESIRLADALELGYLGVDFVIDANKGPVVLEANARPGLAIQVAHGCGLMPRLALIDSQRPEMLTPEHRWELISQLSEMT
jgi:alpha-L-glutamate ligase-like protein